MCISRCTIKIALELLRRFSSAFYPLDAGIRVSSNSELSQNVENSIGIPDEHVYLYTHILDDLDIPCFLISRVWGIFPEEIIQRNTRIILALR